MRLISAQVPRILLEAGEPQAVMVHVNVGTANTINGAANANRDNAPILLMAGRTPISETGHLGSRSRHIHWAQEMYDQAAMVRERVKWDYELRYAEQAASLYVTTRWQGGALLRDHAGVQVRLGQLQSALRDIGSRLAAWPRQPADGDLPNLLLDRMDLHDRCLALSDEALQLMGAAGYLRDTTVARAWRDQRILRQLAGGVADVHRMVALCRVASEGAA